MTAPEIPLRTDDLEGFYREVSLRSRRDRTLSLSHIHLGPDALDELPAAISRQRGGPLVLVMDSTPMMRGEADLKPDVLGRLEALGQVQRIVVPGDSHTTAELVAAIAGELPPGATVVSVGSGTVTDLAKHAIHTAGGTSSHVAVATANSVGAYTSQLAVVTTRGVKRTVPSRLPDELILDSRILASTPRPIALGGVGDASVGWGSLADYRLAALCGLGSFEPVTVPVFQPGLRSFLRRDPAFTEGGWATAEAMAVTLCSAGFAMSFAGESAPASGLEHVTSHVLDMTAQRDGRPIGNHGEQCGLATVLSLLAYHHLLHEVETSELTPEALDPATVEAQVRAAFGPLGGQVADECWADVAVKVDGWNSHLPDVKAMFADWDATRAELLPLLADPRDYLTALHATGHPLRFEDVEPGIPEDQARFAFANARLMRKRLSIADVLAFVGQWDPDALFDQFVELRDEVLAPG